MRKQKVKIHFLYMELKWNTVICENFNRIVDAKTSIDQGVQMF